MKRRGRPILGLISGFFTGLFLGLTLLLFGVIPLDSILLTALPIVLMIIVWALAMWAPFGSRSEAPAEQTQ